MSVGFASANEYNLISFASFGARGLAAYINAGTDDVPWTLIAAVDFAETGTLAEPTDERLSEIRASLVGETIREKVASLRKEAADTALILNYESSLRIIDRMLGEPYIFPISSEYAIYYEDNFGAARTYGGDRSHEGIDIMAEKGVPVMCAARGVVVQKGWNELGGWRIGVSGDDGVYYYYAHFSEYGAYEVGDRVEPGDVIGYVGSTGYGPEGTSDIMESHLHFGMYEGSTAFNAYPFLMNWGRE